LLKARNSYLLYYFKIKRIGGITMNCKEEFLNTIKTKPKVIWSVVYARINVEKRIINILPPEYTDDDFKVFLDKFDFEYDNGYGLQMIYGYIVYADNSWSERFSYDGKECWSYKRTPEFSEDIDVYFDPCHDC
jgi:hypothetical protein